jgi:NDP-sugar pyrophosphorylase family protein
MDINEAIILAGGKGTRLRSVTLNEIPKGLVKIQEKAILQWEIEWLAKYGVKKVVLAIGHLSDKIIAEFSDKINTPHGDVILKYSIEKEKLGSGGAIKQASQFIEGKACFIINGDILSDAKLNDLIELHKNNQSKATMLLVNMRSPYGVVETSGNKITKFVEKPLLPIMIHSGIDIINKEIFSEFPDRGQMEDTIFVDLANRDEFFVYTADKDTFWKSIDTEKDFKEANETWPGL